MLMLSITFKIVSKKSMAMRVFWYRILVDISHIGMERGALERDTKTQVRGVKYVQS